MKIYRYWAKDRTSVRDGEGRTADLTTWRWSNVGVDEARRNAREALAEIARRWQQGEELDSYAYADRPLREEIVEELDDGSDEPAAVITRNAYGSLVLNTRNAMFIDIDAHGGGLLGRLRRVFFGGSSGRRGNGHDAQLHKIRAVVDRRPELNLRVYRTCKGLRCLVTSDLYDPASPTALGILREFGSDPLYVKLCSIQECFRARLSPKHWRIGLPKPPSRFPWESPAREREFREWQRNYETATREYATCELLETIGSGRVRWEVEPVVELHDRHACSPSQPRLA